MAIRHSRPSPVLSGKDARRFVKELLRPKTPEEIAELKKRFLSFPFLEEYGRPTVKKEESHNDSKGSTSTE